MKYREYHDRCFFLDKKEGERKDGHNCALDISMNERKSFRMVLDRINNVFKNR